MFTIVPVYKWNLQTDKNKACSNRWGQGSCWLALRPGTDSLLLLATCMHSLPVSSSTTTAAC
jgi:hypothetical protein